MPAAVRSRPSRSSGVRSSKSCSLRAAAISYSTCGNAVGGPREAERHVEDIITVSLATIADVASSPMSHHRRRRIIADVASSPTPHHRRVRVVENVDCGHRGAAGLEDLDCGWLVFVSKGAA